MYVFVFVYTRYMYVFVFVCYNFFFGARVELGEPVYRSPTHLCSYIYIHIEFIHGFVYI